MLFHVSAGSQGGKLVKQLASSHSPDPFCRPNGIVPPGHIAVWCTAKTAGGAQVDYHILSNSWYLPNHTDGSRMFHYEWSVSRWNSHHCEMQYQELYCRLMVASHLILYQQYPSLTDHHLTDKIHKLPIWFAKVYVHMLNGTMCATECALCCLVENYQITLCPLTLSTLCKQNTWSLQINQLTYLT
jgi:hypothetical protein